MTYRTTIARTTTHASAAVTRRHSLAALLAEDDIVRPELRNDAILEAQRTSRGASRARPQNHHDRRDPR
ncbi:hypothetical protein RSO68_03945 [Halomonas saccharevitans]|uniref:Uncharacterized protein n=1 Tax=Halomonas saccharevitans TaxID=416872 RepID=A0ABU3NBQ5_9GAMM|nr:hypothetical protein [Halomonas saccharevitans]MDT8878619.1 hypothetical protein [Halomonas saccharevitans]